ncbi:hypothetical protein [Streptomyces sp. NPDC058268]|uniref:hypothetical protein n=1 Tax=Streptomyces sp. NPDC058268 TaxID=3346413 RepID=UPI0036E6E3A4
MSPFISDADLGATQIGQAARKATLVADVVAELFGDDFARALYRETAYSVPDDQRLTCPRHQDWRVNCLDLHVDYPAAA